MNTLVCIAIDKYNDVNIENLNNCFNDVNTLMSLLKSRYQFDDTLLISGEEQTTRKNLFNKLKDIFINAIPEDNIVLVFAGHGEFDEFIQTSYWLPSDADHSDSSTWLGTNEVINFIRSSKAFHIAVISDSCFSGDLMKEKTRGGGFIAFNKKRSRLALTSGSIEKVSDGPKDGRSPFADILIKELEDNQKLSLPFFEISNLVILKFDDKGIQTPSFGTIPNCGHEGGSFIFNLKQVNLKASDYIVENYSLDININLPIKFEYKCTLPLFTESLFFDKRSINDKIQSSALKIINEIRNDISEVYLQMVKDKQKRHIGFEISYQIVGINRQYLSMIIEVYHYLGGPYPNLYYYNLNFQYLPEKELKISDIFYYSNIKLEIKKFINDYGINEIKESLLHYVQYMNESNIIFAQNDTTLFLYLNNHLPKVISAGGYLEIPKNTLRIK
ncbi:caspase family protein [Lacihabitans sp. CCS-44]|uniref:caspase family protein n=1 Tax=Lacihabitans sp. CCS-44 TaxID=2487331 RepID=UPI0020CE36B0|nr:caspase family protein [Lacihabitans sp. CCS-44]